MSDDLVKRLRRDAQAARDYLGPPEIAPSISLDDAEDAADRIEAQAAEIKDITDKLLDPNAVHINMLRGGIAKPTLNQIEHLYPEIRELRAEIERLKAEFEAAKIEAQSADMAHGALHNIQELLDSGNVPRGTFADDQVRNLVAMYNQVKHERDAAFRAGAEAMQEAAAKLHDEAAAKLAGGRKRINQFDQYIINVLERKAEEIRALPIGDST